MIRAAIATLFIVAATATSVRAQTRPADDPRAAHMRQVLTSLLSRVGDDNAWPAADVAPLVYDRPATIADVEEADFAAGSTVVLREPMETHPDGAWVGFADGHLELARTPEHYSECMTQHALAQAAQATQQKLKAKPPATTQPAVSGTLKLRIVDDRGNPVAGAIAGVFGNFGDVNDVPHAYFADSEQSATSDAEGLLMLNATDVFHPPFRFSQDRVAPLFVLDVSRKIACITEVTREDFRTDAPENPRTVQLAPVCHVTGDVRATGLPPSTPVGKTTALIFPPGNFEMRTLTSVFKTSGFEFLVPPGDYGLAFHSTNAIGTQRYLHIAPSQRELHLTLDLVPARLQSLIGQPAPELRDIKGWQNTQPFKLADLRGKIVLLDFWGTWCGPCLSIMPDLMKLLDALQDKGLEIVAVHDDSVASIAEMDDALADYAKTNWDGRSLPFRIALDGGGNRRIPGTGVALRGATTAEYGIMDFPTTLLIDAEGKIVQRVKVEDADDQALIQKAVEALPQKPMPCRVRACETTGVFRTPDRVIPRHPEGSVSSRIARKP